MRLSRLIIGAIVILGALWIIVGEQMAGASADAVVNARLAMLRAPVAGTLELDERPLGSQVDLGEKLGAISDPLVDRIRLDDLAMEREFAQAQATRAAALVAATEAALAPLEDRTAKFRDQRIAEIQDRLEHAKARLDVIEAQQVAAPVADLPAEPGQPGDVEAMLDDGQSGAGPEAAAAASMPLIALEYARERVHVLEIELAAAQDGVFLGDGYNDAPWSEQRAEELHGQLADRQAARAESQARLGAVAARISAATAAVNRLSGAGLGSPVDGEVWELRAADGEHLERGQDVMVLLDCGSLLVTASVTESVYNTLSVGDAARFRLSGDGRDFPATVTRLGGSGAQTLYRNLAVAPSPKHLERFDVALLVPGLATAEGLTCPVGRTGRAFFSRRPLDWLRGL